MTTRTEYAHGEFSWVNLGTTDPAAAKRFYGSLFGWQFDDMPAGQGMTYTMCRLGDHYAAGLFALEQMQARGVPAHWMPFVNVLNADEVAAKASQNGGKVLMGPDDVLTVGRSAAIADPTGARLAIWQARDHKGAGVVSEEGAISWNELLSPDVDAAGRFYRATFGWTSDVVDVNEDSSYTIFKSGTTMIAGMMARPPRLKDVPPNWLTYFGVADCDAAAAKVTQLGGTLMQPPTDIPNVGRFAVCRDGQGAAFAIARFNPPAS